MRLVLPLAASRALCLARLRSEHTSFTQRFGSPGKAYDPKREREIYTWWEESGCFKPRPGRSPRAHYTIAFPPPNVTGALHIGHALTAAVQDTLARAHRMMGKETLFLPGVDHAGIATQVAVEKSIALREGKSRHELGRDVFVTKVWEWTEEHTKRIADQLRRTGCSFDWSKFTFSLDEPRSLATREAFIQLYEQGKISRESRLVNWCPTLRSTISDIEVDYREVAPFEKVRLPGVKGAVQVGILFEFRYKIEGSDETVAVATTRPETILGDTALAIHPDDSRYKSLHGRRAVCPFRAGETIPIVCDSELVDMSFGTGVVKVTPAHDANDFECAQRHQLPSVTVFTEDGRMNDAAGPFAGQHRFECRNTVQSALAARGLAVGIKGHSTRIGFCQRTGDVVEKRVTTQWFCDFRREAAMAVDALKKGSLRIVPGSAAHEKQWVHWLTHLQPWCLSRQLWWGHRIPAWHVGESPPEDSGDWFIANTEADARAMMAEAMGLSVEETEGIVLKQDEDVLDTWFTAALYPLAIFGWPKPSADLEKYYPLSVLETGHDILFFWVARMVMMGLSLTDKLPFHTVSLHGMVRDKEGKKMSKSIGNVVDPLDIINGSSLADFKRDLEKSGLGSDAAKKSFRKRKEQFPRGIPECGSDALRFGLLTYTGNGSNINLDIDRIHGYRKFCNKLWNAARFVRERAGTGRAPAGPGTAVPTKWILARLDRAVIECTDSIEKLEFAEAAKCVYRFWYDEFCDVYIEVSKSYLLADGAEAEAARRALLRCVDVGLRLLHPMMPFVTEELYQSLDLPEKAPSVSLAAWPAPEGLADPEAEEQMKLLMNVAHGLRALKAKQGVPSKGRPSVELVCGPQPTLEAAVGELQQLAGVGPVTFRSGQGGEGGGGEEIAPAVFAKLLP